MAQTPRMDAAERKFLSPVSRATFSNPFGDQRDRLDYEISGVQGVADREDLLERVVHRVAGLLGRLDSEGLATLRRQSYEVTRFQGSEKTWARHWRLVPRPTKNPVWIE